MIFTPMFSAALFTIAERCKQPKCSQTNKQNVVYTCSRILFSLTKGRKEILSHAITWILRILCCMNKKVIKGKFCVIPLM